MKGALKWLGYIIGGAIVLVVLAVTAIYAITSSRINRSYATQVPSVAIPTDSFSIARGKHLVETTGKCQACHGDDYSGKVAMDDRVFARLTSANLTAGKNGIGDAYTDEDWVRSIRYGIGRDGKSLIFMPSESFTRLSDQDLGQMIAYLKSLPPVDMTVPPMKSLGPIIRVAYLAGGFPLLPASVIKRDMPRTAVAEGPTAEYGEYLAQAGGCTSCHAANLGGASLGDMKPPNITRGGEVGKWNEADFVRTIRTGVNPSGRTLSAEMPWPYMKGLTDTELSALWAYLQSVKPVAVAVSKN
jgi:mono/diheme cytochrome c family protein